MGSPAIFKGARTGLLSSKGLSLKDGTIVDNDGVPNFIKNGHAEISTTGWATYADSASSIPDNGTGGSANITWTRSTTTPLAGAGSFLFTKDAVNRQGQGVNCYFSIEPAYQARVINIQFDYIVSSGTFAAGTSSADSDITVWIFDITNLTLIQPSSYKLLSNSSTISDTFQASFQTSATGTDYRLILHCATTSASAYTLKLDNFQVTPTQYAFGTPVTDWVSYTPTLKGTTTDPNIGSTGTRAGRWRRVGSDIEVQASFSISGTGIKNGSGDYYITMPSGIFIDSAYVLYNGTSRVFDSGVYDHYGTALPNSTVNGFFIRLSDNISGGSVGQNFPAANWLSSGDLIDVKATAQVTGWSSSVQTSDQTSTRIVDFVGSSTTGQSITANTTKFTFTAYKDSHSAWSTDTYTVPVAGDYSVSLSYYQTTSGAMAAYVHLNGADPGSGKAYLGVAGGSAGFAGSGTVILYNLKVGDAITIKGDATQTLSAGNRTLSISRIAGPNQIAASETVSALYKGGPPTGTLGTAFNTVTFGTKVKDSHGAYSSGSYTIPVSGQYDISAKIVISSSSQAVGDIIAISIFIDGVEAYTQSLNLPSTNTIFFGRPDINVKSIPLKAGQIVTIRSYAATTGPAFSSAAEYQYFSINKSGNY